MSRYYSVHVSCIGKITEKQLEKIMVDDLGWRTDASTWKWIKDTSKVICFSGEGSLCGGQEESEAHDEIVTKLKTIDPKIRVETVWTYLEDLPTTTYGGLD